MLLNVCPKQNNTKQCFVIHSKIKDGSQLGGEKGGYDYVKYKGMRGGGLKNEFQSYVCFLRKTLFKSNHFCCYLFCIFMYSDFFFWGWGVGVGGGYAPHNMVTLGTAEYIHDSHMLIW